MTSRLTSLTVFNPHKDASVTVTDHKQVQCCTFIYCQHYYFVVFAKHDYILIQYGFQFQNNEKYCFETHAYNNVH